MRYTGPLLPLENYFKLYFHSIFNAAVNAAAVYRKQIEMKPLQWPNIFQTVCIIFIGIASILDVDIYEKFLTLTPTPYFYPVPPSPIPFT